MKKKNYQIVIDKEQMKILKSFWERLEEIEEEHYNNIEKLQEEMAIKTGIKNIEFYMSPDDGSYCGIGNSDRTMRLIQRHEL